MSHLHLTTHVRLEFIIVHERTSCSQLKKVHYDSQVNMPELMKVFN